jgi:hypothetical protein
MASEESLEGILAEVLWAVRVEWQSQPCLYCAAADGHRFMLVLEPCAKKRLRYKSEAEMLRADRRYIAGAMAAGTTEMRRCPGCLREFSPRRSSHIYCSPACKVRVRRRSA